jgi:hypothetical protein
MGQGSYNNFTFFFVYVVYIKNKKYNTYINKKKNMSHSFSELVGKIKTKSDLRSRPVRIRYNESQVLNPENGGSFKIDLTRSQTDEFLDCNSLFFKTDLKLKTSDIDGKVKFYRYDFDPNGAFDPSKIHEAKLEECISLDAHYGNCIFSRVIVKSGSHTLLDIQESDLINSWLTTVHTNSNVKSTFDQLVEGKLESTSDHGKYNIWKQHVQNEMETNNGMRTLIFKMSPKKTLLNSNLCLPMGRMRETISVHFYLQKSNNILQIHPGYIKPEFGLPYYEKNNDAGFTIPSYQWSRDNSYLTKIWNDPTDLSIHQSTYNPNLDGIEYELYNTEIICNYLSSNSISSHFNTNGLNVTLTDYQQTFQSILAGESLIRYGSAYSSLNKILVFLRDVNHTNNTRDKIIQNDKIQKFVHGGSLLKYNLLINNINWFDEPITDIARTWKNLTECFPHIRTSDYYDSNYAKERFVLGLNLQSIGSKFTESVSAGLTTSQYNSDIVCNLKIDESVFTNNTTIRCDSFLISDVQLYMTDAGVLRVKY